MTVSDYADIVAALRAVPGVADADVEPDAEGGGLGLLRLGLDPGVDEVQVATKVGRMLRERFGLGVDAEKVQLIEDAAVPGLIPMQGRSRPAISRMQLVSAGLDVTAAVTLDFHGDAFRGEMTATATQSGVHRAVATATLRALEQMLRGRARFELEHVELAGAGGERTVLLSVTMVSPKGTERLSGSAAVREDVRQACIRATLDAVNRRLELLLA